MSEGACRRRESSQRRAGAGATGSVGVGVQGRVPSRPSSEAQASTYDAATNSTAVAVPGCTPLASERTVCGVIKEAAVEQVVEADALKTDASHPEGTGGIELPGFVHVLWGGVLATGESLANKRVRRLRAYHQVQDVRMST